MSWVDVFIVFVCLVSGAYGFWRGFVKEALALVTWLAAIWLAWRGAWMVEPMLGEWSQAPELRIWAARGVVFIVILTAGGLVTWLLRALIRSTGLSSTDRSLGILFGLLRGVLVVGLLTVGLQVAGLEQESWWQSAKFRPFGDRVAAGIRYYADIGRQYIEQNGDQITGPLG